MRAIHQLTEVVARAKDPEPIHSAALDVLLETLGADRAAILLFDPVAGDASTAGALPEFDPDSEAINGSGPRFTAWRGLSAGYRRAVEGHSPWTRAAVDPQPVLVADVLDDANLDVLREAILAEGIRAMAFIPLVSGGRLLGMFMVYFETPHAFIDEEVELAQAIAAQVAFAIDMGRLESELRLANAALAATLDAVTDGITVQAPDGTLLFANDEAAAMLGYETPGELLAAGPDAIMKRFEVFDEDGTTIPLWDLPGRHALQGEEAPERLIRYRHDGSDRWSLVSARPVFAEGGTVRFAVNVFRDVTERHRAVRAVHESERRMRFLAGTTRRLLGSALQYESVLEQVAELFVPELADVCAVRELAPDGTVRRVVTRYADAVDPGVVRRLGEQPDALGLQPTMLEQLRNGDAVLVADIEEAALEAAARAGPEYAGLIGQLGLQSAIIAPLVVDGDAVGVISVVTLRGGRRYDQGDVALVEEVSRRAGLAVQSARRFEEKATVASTLQQALLPPVLPTIPGLELAARYHAAASEIGGDFYDVVQIGASRWVVTVGDVCGKGIEAASLTAMVRYTMRAFAPEAERPSQLLARLNDALLPQLADDRFCTVACGILDTAGEETHLTLSLGGHPRPFLVGAGGEVAAVGAAGTLLGTLPNPHLVDEDMVLRPGEALVIFTDGCIGENPTGKEQDRLANVLRRVAGQDASRLAQAVEMAAHAEAHHTDDLTILAIRRLVAT